MYVHRAFDEVVVTESGQGCGGRGREPGALGARSREGGPDLKRPGLPADPPSVLKYDDLHSGIVSTSPAGSRARRLVSGDSGHGAAEPCSKSGPPRSLCSPTHRGCEWLAVKGLSLKSEVSAKLGLYSASSNPRLGAKGSRVQIPPPRPTSF